MREQIGDALKKAMKSQEKRRISTLRLIMAAVQDRDIALRSKGKDRANEDEVIDLLTKMVKQREESSRLYREGGRGDLEDQELEEITIIREFLPRQLDNEELEAAIVEAIEKTGATGLRDMGKCMSFLKEEFRGRIDFSRAGAQIKDRLN